MAYVYRNRPIIKPINRPIIIIINWGKEKQIKQIFAMIFL